MYLLRRIINPEIFQGKYKKNGYFEGWYYKLIDKDSQQIFGIIPGISKTKQHEHAFVQFIDAKTGITKYIKYAAQDFHFSEKMLDITICKNRFNRFGLLVDIDSDNFKLSGKIDFANIVAFPKSLLNPGIMGPYSFIPFMECYHGIVNMHNDLNGSLFYNGSEIDFTGGYGYVEKDWGKSFPKSWVWFQSNHFENNDASIMFSIASIPWINRTFDGFISFFKLGNKFYRFATYTGAKVKKMSFTNDLLIVCVEDSKHILQLEVKNSKGGILKAPKKGLMEVELTETITSEVRATLSNKAGKKLFSGIGKNTGLELAGDYRKFFT